MRQYEDQELLFIGKWPEKNEKKIYIYDVNKHLFWDWLELALQGYFPLVDRRLGRLKD